MIFISFCYSISFVYVSLPWPSRYRRVTSPLPFLASVQQRDWSLPQRNPPFINGTNRYLNVTQRYPTLLTVPHRYPPLPTVTSTWPQRSPPLPTVASTWPNVTLTPTLIFFHTLTKNPYFGKYQIESKKIKICEPYN